nr:MAG TPA: hypothetical protein [Caudoviricetes sp.]
MKTCTCRKLYQKFPYKFCHICCFLFFAVL